MAAAYGAAALFLAFFLVTTAEAQEPVDKWGTIRIQHRSGLIEVVRSGGDREAPQSSRLGASNVYELRPGEHARVFLQDPNPFLFSYEMGPEKLEKTQDYLAAAAFADKLKIAFGFIPGIDQALEAEANVASASARRSMSRTAAANVACLSMREPIKGLYERLDLVDGLIAQTAGNAAAVEAAKATVRDWNLKSIDAELKLAYSTFRSERDLARWGATRPRSVGSSGRPAARSIDYELVETLTADLVDGLDQAKESLEQLPDLPDVSDGNVTVGSLRAWAEADLGVDLVADYPALSGELRDHQAAVANELPAGDEAKFESLSSDAQAAIQTALAAAGNITSTREGDVDDAFIAAQNLQDEVDQGHYDTAAAGVGSVRSFLTAIAGSETGSALFAGLSGAAADLAEALGGAASDTGLPNVSESQCREYFLDDYTEQIRPALDLLLAFQSDLEKVDVPIVLVGDFGYRPNETAERVLKITPVQERASLAASTKRATGSNYVFRVEPYRGFQLRAGAGAFYSVVQTTEFKAVANDDGKFVITESQPSDSGSSAAFLIHAVPRALSGPNLAVQLQFGVSPAKDKLAFLFGTGVAFNDAISLTGGLAVQQVARLPEGLEVGQILDKAEDLKTETQFKAGFYFAVNLTLGVTKK